MSAVSKHIANFRHFREALTDVLLGVCIYLSRYLRACLYVGQRVRFIHLFEISLPTEYVSCSLQMCVVVTSYMSLVPQNACRSIWRQNLLNTNPSVSCKSNYRWRSSLVCVSARLVLKIDQAHTSSFILSTTHFFFLVFICIYFLIFAFPFPLCHWDKFRMYFKESHRLYF